MLGMKLPVSYPSIATTPQRSLYEYMLSGDIPMAVGGIDMINIIELEDGDYRIKHN